MQYNDQRQYVGIPGPDGSKSLRLSFNTATSAPYWATGPKEVKLISEDKGMCFITKVSGGFDGFGESIKLNQKDGAWHLRLDSACRDKVNWWDATDDCLVYKTIEADIVCLAYDQSVEGEAPPAY